MKTLMDNVERERKVRGLTIKELCADLNVSSVSYHKWKNGEAEPSMKRVIQLSEYFNMPMQDLMGEKKTAALSGDGELPQSARELIALLSTLDEPSIRFLLKKAQELVELQQFRDALE